MPLIRVRACLHAVDGSDLYVPTLVALGTGLRRGEVLGLRWRDIDLDARTACVARTLQTDMSFTPPKSHRTRTFTVPGFVADALRAHSSQQAARRLRCGSAWAELDLVCDRGDGRPVRPWSLTQRFGRAMARAGIDLTFHELRHGNATLLLDAGVALKVTQVRLGHSTIGVTADTYTHVADDVDRDAAARLDAHMGAVVASVCGSS